MAVTVRQKQPGKNNPWYVFINHGGKRKAKCIGDKKAAEAVASKIRERLKLGEFRIVEEKPRAPLFKDYAQGWVDTYAAAFCKYSTASGYETMITKHLVPFFKGTAIDEIQRRDVKALVTSKIAEGLSVATVKNIRLCLSSILSSALDDEIIKGNPATDLGKKMRKFLRLARNGKNVTCFTRGEVSLFLNTALTHYPEHYPLFLCAVRTGMRFGELLALQPGDLDFHGGFIEVQRSIVRGRITTPKNGKTRRVDMSHQLMAVLKEHLRKTKEQKLAHGWEEMPEWLFYNEDLQPLDQANLRHRVFYKCLAKAGLRRIRFHDLRHTYASLLISQGESLAYVKEQMGHHSIQVTVDTYGHLIPGSNRQAVDKLDDMHQPATQAQPEHTEEEKKVLSVCQVPVIVGCGGQI